MTTQDTINLIDALTAELMRLPCQSAAFEIQLAIVIVELQDARADLVCGRLAERR